MTAPLGARGEIRGSSQRNARDAEKEKSNMYVWMIRKRSISGLEAEVIGCVVVSLRSCRKGVDSHM